MQIPLLQQSDAPLIRFSLEPLQGDFGIPLALMGILVVFMALSLVMLLITVLPKVLGRVLVSPLPPAAETTSTSDGGLSEETVAVIAAAVAATMRQPHRIVKIRGLSPGEMGWSLEGRMQHHRSHHVKR